MTGRPDDPKSSEFDPGSMSASSFGTVKALWYKRPWVLVTIVILLVIGVSIVTDLPHHITPAQDTGDQNSAVRQINFDLKTCNYSVTEAFNFYRLDVNKKLSQSNYKLALHTYLPEDRQSCSFVSSALTDMTGNLQIVDTTAGKQIEKLRLTVVRWIDHDAQNAIKDIIVLFSHPGDPKAMADLVTEENYLAQDRQTALGYLGRADNILGVTLVNLNLATPARLPGT
jgi:hypothetical protein